MLGGGLRAAKFAARTWRNETWRNEKCKAPAIRFAPERTQIQATEGSLASRGRRRACAGCRQKRLLCADEPCVSSGFALRIVADGREGNKAMQLTTSEISIKFFAVFTRFSNLTLTYIYNTLNRFLSPIFISVSTSHVTA